MKFLAVFVGVTLLTGCALSTSHDIKKAEQMFSLFQCKNIEVNEMAHSSITAYHEQQLHTAKQKAEDYITHYKDGEKLFDVPLSSVIEQQYTIYKEACENLGGIQSNTVNES